MTPVPDASAPRGALLPRLDAFVGLDVSVDTVNALLAAVRNVAPALSGRLEGARWVSPLDLHVLLASLADVREEVLEGVADVLAEHVGELDPFDLAVRGLMLGPDPRAASGLWAGLLDPSSRLDPLVATTEAALESIGFVPPFRGGPPHIAIALFPTVDLPSLVRAAIDTLAEEGFGLLHVTHVTLFVRDPAPDGTLFRPVHRVPLRMIVDPEPPRFAAPDPERTEPSASLEDRARRQLEDVRGESDP